MQCIKADANVKLSNIVMPRVMMLSIPIITYLPSAKIWGVSFGVELIRDVEVALAE